MTYVKPQLQVFQEFRQAPQAVVRNLNAFIFGANYQLFRYAEAAEKALIGVGAYDKDNPQTFNYPNQPAGSSVDTDYVEVYAENAWLKCAQVDNSAVNPLFAVSEVEMNHLRAAPRIEDSEKAASATPTWDSGGFHTGLVTLPEAYYWTPVANFVLGTGAGVLDYLTTEGLTGTTAIGADACDAGVVTQGPHGIAMDWDNGAAVQAPRIITFTGDLGDTFTLSMKNDNYPAAIDADIDDTEPYTISHIVAALAVAITAAHALSIDFQATDTLAAIRAAIVAVPDVVAVYDVSAIGPGAGAGDAVTIEDQDAVGITVATPMLPDAWRVKIFDNSWIFKTANGYTRSALLLRDVMIGDRVRLLVTPALTGIEEELLAKVVGLEADYTLPALGAAAADTDNQATQAGDDLSAGVAALVAPGSDNQRDFDGVGTKVFSLSATCDYMFSDMARGVLIDTFTVTITTGGLKAVARATVTNTAGTYSRTNVLIEDQGADDGQIYIGNNMYVNLDQGGGDPDAVFQVGDTYVVGAVDCPYAAISNQTVAGTYGGTQDTTYLVEVTRGGVFDRAADVSDGLQVPGVATVLTAAVGDWTGGDVDDEYVLEVITAGSLTTAVFKLTSQRGDNQASVTFSGVATDVEVGTYHLKLQFSVDVAFTLDDYWIVKVFCARPQAKVTDSAGIDQTVTDIVNDGVAINLGLNGGSITFPTNAQLGLALGEIFTVLATASAPGKVQTLVLSDEVSANVVPGLQADGDANLVPDRFQAELFLIRNSVEIPEEQHDPAVAPGNFNWEAAAGDITVNDAITLQDSEWVDAMGEMPYLELWYGDLFTQYRALLPGYSDTIYSIDDLAAVEDELGTVDPDNPLAEAVYKALENSGPSSVYFMAVPTDNLAGFNNVLDKASLVDVVFAFGLATRDAAVVAAVEAHVNAMSSPEDKKWRIAFFGSTMPVYSDVLTPATNPGGVDWLATIIDDPRTPGNQYRKVVLTLDGSLLENMTVGDEVRFKYSTDAWGNEGYETGEVAEIESDTVFYLVDSLAAPVVVASRLESYHPLSVAEKATALAAQSKAYYDRRSYNIFPPTLNAYGEALTSEFAAAGVAGLVSACVPQQGLTFTELAGFDDLPMSYSLFNSTQLDEIAAGGTMIVMQEVANGPIFIRHQISTQASGGILNETELSLVKNLDSICYFFSEQLAGYIGRYNVTPELLAALRTQVKSGLAYLGSLTSVGLLGPQINLEQSELVSLQQHPTLADRIVVRMRIGLPPPLNVIETHIVV